MHFISREGGKCSIKCFNADYAMTYDEGSREYFRLLSTDGHTDGHTHTQASYAAR